MGGGAKWVGYLALYTDDVWSCRCSRRWHLSGDVKFPMHRYLMES
jgi:hypothetical protein